MSSPERLALEIKMRDIYDNPEEFLPMDECERGTIYWSNSSHIGQVALCAGVIDRDGAGALAAIGLAEQRGEYRLQFEYYKQKAVGSHVGYWRPHVALPWATEGTPEDVVENGIEAYFATGAGSACRKLFNLLLDTEIEVTQDKIDWLKSLPPSLKQTYAHKEKLEINEINLADLQHLRQERLDSGVGILLCHAAAVKSS
jgi:hypothetical protein